MLKKISFAVSALARLCIALLCGALLCGTVSASESRRPAVTAKGYALIEAKTGRLLAGANENTRLPVASTTKIMTALLALSQPRLDDEFVVDSNAIKVEGTSMGLREGDRVTLRALAHGMLLPSGNDAANAAAVKIGGSIKGFASIMNDKAAELSMTNTNFVTPSGLHDDNHYSTAYDMALLASAALENKAFSEICKKQKAEVWYGNPPYRRTISNHNKLLSMYEGCIGVKTGFTKKAGRCLVSAAERDGITLICVTLQAADDWNAHKALFDYGFAAVPKTRTHIDTDDISVRVVGGEKRKVAVRAHTAVTVPLETGELSKLERRVYVDKFRYATVKEGDILGRVELLYNGRVIAETSLLSQETVLKAQKSAKHGGFFKKLGDLLKFDI